MNDHIRFAKRLTTILDIRFSFLGIRFGIDPLFDLIPVFGNYISTATSMYLFYIAYRLNVPTVVYVRMAVNIVLDYLLGVIPFIGVIFDLAYRSNVRNFTLLEAYLEPDVLEGDVV